MEESQDSAKIELLLSDAEAMRPVLDGGLPELALAAAPAPDRAPRGADSMHLDAPDRDPNDLPAQRWAVIAGEGEAGKQAIEAIRALIDHRGAHQGAPPVIFRVPPAMDALAAIRWKNNVLRAEDRPEDERPRYLLILGDLDQVSLELQHVVQNGAFVGRLHCPTIQGYRAYAEKVVAAEQAERAERGRSLFYTVQDGTSAITSGYGRLVEPCMAMAGEWAKGGKLDIDGPTELPYSDWGPDEMLTAAAATKPSVMLSLSHGLGAPRRGWRSPDEQRALQGALALGADGPLSADAVREAPFLPGGIWMCIACFAAGTPSQSAFYPWLELLAAKGGDSAAAQEVLRSLPKAGDRPFVAALPQALLANPRGPLAIIGHMDLAWTFGFTDPMSKKSRASRMFSTLRALLAGARAGVGLDALMHVYRETNDDLMARYQLQRDAVSRGQPDPVEPSMLGDLWMQRNDLRGYVLLGDPAARLGIKSDRPALQATPRRAAAATMTDDVVTGKATATAPPPTRASPVEPEPAASPAPEPAASPAPELAAAPPEPAASPAPELAAAPPEPTAPPASRDLPLSAPAAAQEPVKARMSTTPETPPAPPPPSPYGQASTGVGVHYAQAPMPVGAPHYAQAPMPVGAPHYAQAPTAVGAAPAAAIARPHTLENHDITLRERAVLALIRGDEAPRSIAIRFGLPIEEIFYWLDIYREAGRRSLAG